LYDEQALLIRLVILPIAFQVLDEAGSKELSKKDL